MDCFHGKLLGQFFPLAQNIFFIIIVYYAEFHFSTVMDTKNRQLAVSSLHLKPTWNDPIHNIMCTV